MPATITCACRAPAMANTSPCRNRACPADHAPTRGTGPVHRATSMEVPPPLHPRRGTLARHQCTPVYLQRSTGMVAGRAQVRGGCGYREAMSGNGVREHFRKSRESGSENISRHGSAPMQMERLAQMFSAHCAHHASQSGSRRPRAWASSSGLDGGSMQVRQFGLRADTLLENRCALDVRDRGRAACGRQERYAGRTLRSRRGSRGLRCAHDVGPAARGFGRAMARARKAVSRSATACGSRRRR